MKMTDALEVVSKMYIPGAVAHYDRMKPNPWQKAHDEFEGMILHSSGELREMACSRFIDKIRILLDRYKKNLIDIPDVSPVDAFILGDVDRVKRFQSRKNHCCFVCESTLNISLISNDKAQVAVVCAPCKSKIVQARA